MELQKFLPFLYPFFGAGLPCWGEKGGWEHKKGNIFLEKDKTTMNRENKFVVSYGPLPVPASL